MVASDLDLQLAATLIFLGGITRLLFFVFLAFVDPAQDVSVTVHAGKYSVDLDDYIQAEPESGAFMVPNGEYLSLFYLKDGKYYWAGDAWMQDDHVVIQYIDKAGNSIISSRLRALYAEGPINLDYLEPEPEVLELLLSIESRGQEEPPLKEPYDRDSFWAAIPGYHGH